MRFLPLCLDLSRRCVLVVGSGREARLKLQTLAPYDTSVVLCAPQVSGELRAAAAACGAEVLERAYAPEVLDGVGLAYACTEDRTLDRTIGADARARGILVNVVDDPAGCDVVSPALYRSGHMTVAVSSDGRDVRRSIAWRDRVRALLEGTDEPAVPGAAWDATAPGAPDAGDEPAASGAARAAAAPGAADTGTAAQPAGRGKVWLVGFGPGDPDLLTLRAHRVLTQADILVYDDLVDATALSAYPGRKVYAGKRGARRESTAQETINELLYAAAALGENVARVKGGDPLIFGRAGEELCYLRERGIEVEIVPGVSAAHAAAAVAGIPLTMRGLARRLELRTGQACSAPAGARGTVCYYMAAARLREIAAELSGEGWPAATPVALVESATLPAQRCRVTTLGDLPLQHAASPVLVIAGEVVALAEPALLVETAHEQLREAVR